MRIAFFHELPEGGARIATNEIARFLKNKHKVDLYYSDSKLNKEEVRNYNKAFFFKFNPKSWHGKNFRRRIYKDTIELFKLSKLHKKIAKQIDSQNYDLVFVNASKFIESPFILKYLKTKKVFYLHDPHFRMVYEDILKFPKTFGFKRSIYEHLHRKILKTLDNQNIKCVDLLIANSKYTSKTAFKTYGIKSVVSYLGIDTHFFKPAGIIKKRYDLLYIGSHDILDGFDIFEDVLKNLENVKVKSVFKDEEWISQERVRDLYRESKVVICLGIDEPLGLIPLEAAACGLPVVAFDRAGYRETILDKKTGYLVKNNSSEISIKVKRLLSNNKLMKKMGEAGRKEISNKWDMQKKVDDLEKILIQFNNKS